jgi:hypothetical protein
MKKKPMTSAERMAAYRQRRKNEGITGALVMLSEDVRKIIDGEMVKTNGTFSAAVESLLKRAN